MGSERKNSLPRRLPKFHFPHYRSKRNFEKIPVQRAAKPLCGVILAERKKDRPQRAGSPVLSVLCTQKPDGGSLRQLQSKFLPRCQNPHGQFRPCCVWLFQERPYHHRCRQNGASTGSGSRCYTGADLPGVNWDMKKAATPGSVAVDIKKQKRLDYFVPSGRKEF